MNQEEAQELFENIQDELFDNHFAWTEQEPTEEEAEEIFTTAVEAVRQDFPDFEPTDYLENENTGDDPLFGDGGYYVKKES